MRRKRSSPTSSSRAASKSGTAISFLFKLATEFFVLALEHSVSAEVINSTMLSGGHEPGAPGFPGTRPIATPLIERGEESILCGVLGETDVASTIRMKAGDEPRRLDSTQTASIARCVSVAGTATDHTIINPLAQDSDTPCRDSRGISSASTCS